MIIFNFLFRGQPVEVTLKLIKKKTQVMNWLVKLHMKKAKHQIANLRLILVIRSLINWLQN